jgi:phosphatidylglycerophosphate synthase
MVNKIPLEYENPIDVILYNQVDRDLEFYKKLGLTPNGLTTISLILALVGIYNFHYDNYFISALLFFISYYFDCADGKMARKYQMYSKFGDYYDHFSDLAKLILLFYVFYKKSFDKFVKILIVALILFTLTLFYANCQEKIYGKNSESIFLNFLNIKLDNCEEKMKYFKYFGSGTPITFLTISMLLWNKI